MFIFYTGASYFLHDETFVFILYNAPHSTHLTHKRPAKPYLFSLSVLLLLQPSPQHFLRASTNTPSWTILRPSLQDKPSENYFLHNFLQQYHYFPYDTLLLANLLFFKRKLMLEVDCIPVIAFEKTDLINAARGVY